MTRPRDRQSAQGLLPLMEARPRAGGGFTYRYHPRGGKPIHLGHDKAEAIRKVLDLNARASDQGTLQQLWRLYEQSPAFARLAPGTQRAYTEQWRVLAPVWSGAIAAAVRPADIARYLRVERADAPTAANRGVALLSNLFNVAVERGQIDRNPCREVRRNPETPRTRLVESAELQAFVDWALAQPDPSSTVLVSMAQFSALTGNRRAEFLQLHWPQVDDAEQIIRLTRAKQRGAHTKRELVSISTALATVLERMRALPTYNPMGPVFRAPRTSNPYTDAGFKAMWARLMAKAMAAGVITQRFTFHDLRAHYTSYFKIRHGVLPEMHADPGTTARVYERTRVVRRDAL